MIGILPIQGDTEGLRALPRIPSLLHLIPTLKALHNSLFLPYLSYGTLIWGSTYSSYLESLYGLQKKAIRIISLFTSSYSVYRSKPLFCKLQALPLHSIYKFQVSSSVFAYFHNLLPLPLSSLLQFNCNYHDYETRSRFNLNKSFLKHQFAIGYQAPNIWNVIPINVRNSLTTNNFKRVSNLII